MWRHSELADHRNGSSHSNEIPLEVTERVHSNQRAPISARTGESPDEVSIEPFDTEIDPLRKVCLACPTRAGRGQSISASDPVLGGGGGAGLNQNENRAR